MSGLFTVALGALAAIVFNVSAAFAQEGDAAWAATVEKAKSDPLVLVYSDNKAFDTIVEEFTKKYGIKVQTTVARPTVILPRVKTEQTNGQYLWDVWWSITANMVNVAAPAGMLQPFEPFLMLPEVKDVNQWRHKDYIYGDPGKFVFTYSHEVSFSVYHNVDVVPGVKLDTLDALLDPRFKGKIIARDASQPNSGAFALSPIYKAKGEDFLRKFLKDQAPKILDNPQQLDTSLMRGGAAIAVGMQNTSYATCTKDGGCKNITPMPQLAITLSRGLSVFKNAPHPEAAKIFINWLLSKEGQTVAVREWAKYNLTGAVSMRKDVEPHPDHKADQPDFSNPDQYVWVSTDDGSKEIDAVVKIFNDVMGK
jgi:iron(III) transport system substrate-binding protein